MIYVDANYWIYWLDQRLPEHKYVTEFMRKAIDEGIILNTVSLMEVAHYLRHIPAEDFKRKMNLIQNLSTLTLIDLDHSLTSLSIEQLVKYAKIGIGGRDSIIIATMIVTKTKRIATHDMVFKKVKDLDVIDTIPQGV